MTILAQLAPCTTDAGPVDTDIADVRDLSSCRSGKAQGSGDQSPADTEGQLCMKKKH